MNRPADFYQFSAMERNAKSANTHPQTTTLMQRGWLRFAVMLVLGAVAALALPSIGAWPLLGFVAIAFHLARKADLRPVYVQGFALGLGYFVVALHWIGYAFLVDADHYFWMMPFAVGGLSAFLALYWGLAFVAARLLMRAGGPWFVAFPLTIAMAEILRGILFTGFPWAAPGLVADDMGGLLQVASLVGMQGLGFWLLLWSSLATALALRGFISRAERLVAILVLLLLPAGWIWGNWRVANMPQETVPGVRLLLVQPNIPQDEKWQSANAGGIFDTLLRLSTGTAGRPTHIIWPESAVPFLIDEDADAQARLQSAFDDDQTLLTGAIRRQADGAGGEDYFTSILMFDGVGRLRATYDKWRLVPGGEFLPLAWLLEPLGFRKVVSLPESFTAGHGPASLEVPQAGHASPLICYEVIFPQQLVDAVRRPDWLINVTNDGWFGLSTGPYQHLAQARMRAVEQNLPLVRAANTGISAIIDGAGRYLARSELGQQVAVAGPLPRAGDATAFSRFGLWAAILPQLLVFLGFFYLRNRSLITQPNSIQTRNK